MCHLLGAGEKDYSFSESLGAMVIILGELGSKLFFKNNLSY